jgi:hypothetical protein
MLPARGVQYRADRYRISTPPYLTYANTATLA